MTRPLVVANWKMHGSQVECRALSQQIVRALRRTPARADVVLAPPHTALATVDRAIGKEKIKLAAQNCHWEASGAFTGEVSPAMIRELGCDFVILGHSERRQIFHENDEMIAKKIMPVLNQGMRAILCVGETLEERLQKQTTKVITRQLRIALKGLAKTDIGRVEIAYEPVWAIGTGHNATPEQISQVHGRIRAYLTKTFTARPVRILYGGSVKPENAQQLAAIKEVDGFLVGGASLKAETFLPVVHSFSKK
jgi:triosephosphate isomerase